MSAAAEELKACGTCAERPVYAKGECHTCRSYRIRTGERRPNAVILANFEARSRGVEHGHPGAAARVLSELRIIMGHVGALHPGDVRAEVICAPCGTVKAWPKGSPLPLCQVHRGWLAIAGAVLDSPSDFERIRQAMVA